MRPGETREQWLRCVARNTFRPEAEDHEPYFDGLFAITTGIVKVDRKHYPTQVYLRIKIGDPRAALQLEPHWSEIERLHADLGRILDEREKLKKKLAPYREGALR